MFEKLEIVVIVLHVLTAVSLIALVLLQQGKGADIGASFGSGSSQTVFGASGGANVLTRTTAILAALFFATSLGLAVYARQQAAVQGNVNPDVPVVQESEPQAADDMSEASDDVPVMEDGAAPGTEQPAAADPASDIPE